MADNNSPSTVRATPGTAEVESRAGDDDAEGNGEPEIQKRSKGSAKGTQPGLASGNSCALSGRKAVTTGTAEPADQMRQPLITQAITSDS